MRKLTITRQKSFVASMGKTKIYIEDYSVCDLAIKGVPCKYLGSIKNGETVTFDIEDKGARLYAIAGKGSKDYCNELYVLPEGTDDITLTGKHKYSPSAGNPFRFDQNFSEEALENRRSGSKKGKIILAIAIVVGFVAGFLIPKVIDSIKAGNPMEVEFEDLRITITEQFEEDTVDGETVYVSNDVGLSFLEEKFSEMGGYSNYTAKEYARLSQLANDVDSEIIEEDGLCYFTFTDTVGLTSYKYFCFSFKEDDAFWIVQFWTEEGDADKYESKIFEWAKTVEFE